ncbi:uncharacterized protein LOC143238644 [Tachypleus tridentatus]|uniref:uncharacterized protein LOC143238644 n=1 Tax=Tachypleus tridentatus TaxID=6853 RepID=UPI003FCFC85D
MFPLRYLAFYFYVVSVVYTAELCTRYDDKCQFGNCLSSVPCYHGACDDVGNCICDVCWEGGNCDVYVNKHLPEFPTASEVITISDAWTAGPVFTAHAYDWDVDTICLPQSAGCDCGQVSYYIISETTNGPFIINNATGEVYIRDPVGLAVGTFYKVVIQARGPYNETSDYSGTMEVLFYLDEDFPADQEIQPIMIPTKQGEGNIENVDTKFIGTWDENDDLAPHIREKRQAEVSLDPNNHLTSFNLSILSGDPATMEIGKFIDYKLEILVPQTSQLDLIVEIFTKEVADPSYTPGLALYNVVVGPKPDGMDYSMVLPDVTHSVSDDIPNVNDRAIIDFGMVSNPGGENIIVITFSVTMVRNSIVDQKKYYVTAGAEYDNENYVWVGQSEVIANDITSGEDTREAEVDINGPETIALDSAGIFTVDAYLSFRSDIVSFEVLGPTNEQDVISIGNLGIIGFGSRFYSIPQNIYHYKMQRTDSETGDSYLSATLNMGLVTNSDSFGNPVRDPKNLIQATFAIYALNNATFVGKELTVTAGISIGDLKIWVALINITLTTRVDGEEIAESLGSIAYADSEEASPGGLVMYNIETNMTSGYFSNYRVLVDVPISGGLPQLEPCSGKLLKEKAGFNIPYVNSTPIEPVFDNTKYIFDFGRIYVSNQRNPYKFQDNVVVVEIVLRVASHDANTNGTELTIEMEVDHTGTPFAIVVAPLTVTIPSYLPVPNISLENAVEWSNFYVGGAIALDVIINMPPGVGYGDVIFEAVGENDTSLPNIHVCSAELTHIGSSLPCTSVYKDLINNNQTIYDIVNPDKNATMPDFVQMKLGDVSALSTQKQNITESQLYINLVFDLLETDGVTITSGDIYSLGMGLSLGSTTIWAGEANFTMESALPPTLTTDKEPTIYTRKTDDTPLIPGFMGEFEIIVKTAPKSISPYTIELTTEDTEISVCGMSIKSSGKSMPCFSPFVEPVFTSHLNPFDGNKKGVLDIKMITNVGSVNSTETAEPDDNTIVITAFVRISPTAAVDKNMTWIVTYGALSQSGTLTIPVMIGGAPSPYDSYVLAPKSLEFSLKNPNMTGAGIGAPLVLNVEFELQPNAVAPVIVNVINPDADSGKYPYDICVAGITKRGKNYPCFSPLQLTSNISISNPGATIQEDTGTFDLGIVCHTLIDKEDEGENKVQLSVAVKPVDDGSLLDGEVFSISAVANVGNRSILVSIVNLTAADVVQEIYTSGNATLKRINDTAIPLAVRNRTWVQFNITIPPESLIKVSVEAMGAIADDRAIITVHGLRLVSGGANIPCPFSKVEPDVMMSSRVNTTQTDTVKVDLGYFSNVAFTHNLNISQEGDDDITVEVEIEMSDHPLAEHASQHSLTLGVEAGAALLLIEQPIEVIRDGTEVADIETSVIVDNSKVYQRSEIIPISMSIAHTNLSRAEPSFVTLRLYLPPYISFYEMTYVNISQNQIPDFKNDSGGLDIIFPFLVFSDEVILKFTLIADPENKRGFGKGEINATTPYRLLCKPTYRATPVANPTIPDTLLSCSLMNYIAYEVNSEECYDPLGMESGEIKDCQITASSAKDPLFAPYKARKGGAAGVVWAPSMQQGSYVQYLQVDFQQLTRVTRILVIKDASTRYVTQFRLMYGNTGSDWLYANEKTPLTYVGDEAISDLVKPIQARYIRLTVEEANTDASDTYIGLRVEFYGCSIGPHINMTCPPDPTVYASDTTRVGRHFAVDTVNDIVYFCDAVSKISIRQCFSSADGGTTWKAFSRNIAEFLGYDTSSELVYATDPSKRAYVATKDGINWQAVTEAKYNEVAAETTYQNRVTVPAYTRPDLESFNLQQGNWKATFDGLLYNGDTTPKAKWSKCCTMT